MPADTAPAAGARKTVTVLFSDVAGSTSLGEQLDAESLRHVMDRYFDQMRAVLERHGGTVEKFIGDAVMAVFGIPVVHEDDALRAVRAAHEMGRALSALNEDLEREWGVRLAMRIGVNTGEVVTGQGRGPGSAAQGGQRLVTGDAVNVAARLEQAASAGEVLIGEETLRLVRDAVVTETVAPLSLKGKAEPVPAHRLVGMDMEAAGYERRFDSPMAARHAPTGVRRGAGGPVLPPVHHPGPGRRGEVPAGPGVPGGDAPRHPGPAGTVPLVRRGDHVLARGRGDQAGRRHHGLGRPRRRQVEALRADGPGRSRPGRGRPGGRAARRGRALGEPRGGVLGGPAAGRIPGSSTPPRSCWNRSPRRTASG